MRRSGIGLAILLLLGGCGQKDDGAGQVDAAAQHPAVHRGLELLADGQIGPGLAELRKVSELQPVTVDRVPDWHARAVAELLEHRRWGQADSLLRLTGPISRRPPEQRYLTAQLLMLQGEPHRALDVYATVTGNDDLMTRVHFERAMIHSMLGDDLRAAESAEATLRLDPADSAARALLVSSLIAQNRAEQALAEAADLPSGRARATLEAHAWLALGVPDSAAARLDLIPAEERDDTATYLLGWTRVEQRQPEEALRAMEDLLARGYKDVELLAAQALGQLGRDEQARELQARHADRKRAAQVEALWNRGLATVQEAGPAAAYPYLQDAIDLDPDNPMLLNDAGAILTMLRRFDEAEARFQQALALRPNDPSTYGNLVQLYEITGETEKREDALRRMADAMQQR